ncbi:MAG: hypothetical protein ACRCZU_03685, partial [Selenomonadaceae bacterium]
TCTAFAAEGSFFHKPMSKIGVVIIGSADLKTPDYFNSIAEKLADESGKIYTVETGTVVQSKYQQYWFDKGFLDEQKLTKQDLNEFVKYSGYDKVLFLSVSDPVMEKTSIPAGWFTTVQQTRASIEVKAYLADPEMIIKAVDVSKEDDSQTSELRAKRGAFQKDINEIASQLKGFLK